MKYYVIELDGKPYNGVEADGEAYNKPIGGGYFSPTTRDMLVFGESDEPHIIAGSINLKSTIDRLLSRERSEGLIADNLTIRAVPKEYTTIAKKNNSKMAQFNIIQSIKNTQGNQNA